MSDVGMLKQRESFKDIAKGNMRNYSMFIVLIAIIGIFAGFTSGINLSAPNITRLIIQNSYILILAIGMLLVILLGNIDLSVGSVVAFVGALSAMLYNSKFIASLPPALGLGLTILGGLLIGAVVGVFQGSLIAFLKIPAFIVTLGGMLVFRGLTYLVTNVTPVAPHDDLFKKIAMGSFSPEFLQWTPDFFQATKLNELGKEVKVFANVLQPNHEGIMTFHFFPVIIGLLLLVGFVIFSYIGRKKKIDNDFHVLPIGYFVAKIVALSVAVLAICVQFGCYKGLPTVVMVLGIVIAVFVFITKSTVFGRYVYAVGGNARSAKLSGINSEMVTFMVHVNMGIVCALAAIVHTAYMNQALPQAGNLLELDAIASCFIGGASTSGGIGTVMGAITGALVMGVINNGMVLMSVGAHWQYVVKGSVLLLAVWYDIYTRKKAGAA